MRTTRSPHLSTSNFARATAAAPAAERVVECTSAPLTSQEDIRAACAPLSFDGMQRAALPNELHRIGVAMADGTVTALVLRVGRTVRGPRTASPT